MRTVLRAASAPIVLLSIAVALIGGVGVYDSLTRPSKGAPPARVAGEYVKGLAHNAGVSIIGDKVWSVRKLKSGVTVVVVRVRYVQKILLGVTPTGTPVEATSPPQVITLYVRLLQSGYSVVG